ncbi:MAG: putative toxin-antitoxin system toxin component, PIN family [Chloroflexi bacterium]|nr:putative toxin-antitoxin system toxin component, PIN family [Chloroflexota bacterium]
MRVVIDTNVIVSAYLGGALETILRAFKAARFQLVVSQAIADEYLSVLARPKFKIDQDALDDFAALLVSHAEFVSPEETIHAVSADPTDNKFLEAAVAGNVIYVVSGDSHLLQLKTFRGIAIIPAREFIARLD